MPSRQKFQVQEELKHNFHVPSAFLVSLMQLSRYQSDDNLGEFPTSAPTRACIELARAG